MSSGLNSLSAVFITDLLQLGCKVEISENTRTVISKLISLVFGLLSFGIVFLMKYLPGVLQVSKIRNIISSIIFATFRRLLAYLGWLEAPCWESSP